MIEIAEDKFSNSLNYKDKYFSSSTDLVAEVLLPDPLVFRITTNKLAIH